MDALQLLILRMQRELRGLIARHAAAGFNGVVQVWLPKLLVRSFRQAWDARLSVQQDPPPLQLAEHHRRCRAICVSGSVQAPMSLRLLPSRDIAPHSTLIQTCVLFTRWLPSIGRGRAPVTHGASHDNQLRAAIVCSKTCNNVSRKSVFVRELVSVPGSAIQSPKVSRRHQVSRALY